MKGLYTICVLLGLFLIVGCQSNQENTMILLDEKVAVVNISKSNGLGDMNQDILLSFNNEQSIKMVEKAIRTAVKQKSDINVAKPDFDVMVEYGEGLPTHAIHLWLGEENKQSTLMYMVGEGETYLTSSKATDQLRELILSEPIRQD